MRRRIWPLIVCVVCALPLLNADAQTKKDDLPRLPGAALLMGYPPASLIVTTASNTWRVGEGNDVLLSYVTISRDGTTIASARLKEVLPPLRRIFAIGTYSTKDGKWTEYDQVEDLRAGVAISPDGTKLAFPVGYPARLRIIDLRTKRVIDSPVIGLYSEIKLSWSPDGRRIVYDMNQSTPEELILHRPAIFVVDVQTGEITKVADGEAPAWSPSGKWIAYFDHSEDVSKEQWDNAPAPNRLLIIRPDGTGSRVLVTLPRDRAYAVSPVWSPDSKTILLNEIWDQEKGTVSVGLLDLATLKLAVRFEDVPPVFGWAEAK